MASEVSAKMAKTAGIVALASMVLFVGLLWVAVSNFPNYSFSENFISDLGVHPQAAPWFQAAIGIAGLGVLLFSLLAWQAGSLGVPRMALQVLAAASAFLWGVAVFDKVDSPLAHLIATGGFFGLIALSCLLTGWSWVRKGQVRFGGLAVTAGVLLLGFIAIAGTSPQPLLQKIAVGMMVFVFATIGLGLVFRGVDTKRPQKLL